MPAAIFDHLGDGGAFGAERVDGFLHVASGVVLPVAAQDDAADCEVGVGAVGAGAGGGGQLVHLFELVGGGGLHGWLVTYYYLIK